MWIACVSVSQKGETDETPETLFLPNKLIVNQLSKLGETV
jgi:hypothetical protein